MSETQPGEARTRTLGIPLLNPAEVEGLHTEGFGIIPADITRFETYEDWVGRNSDSTWGQGFFLNGVMFEGYKELQCMQRYKELYPDEYDRLVHEVNEIQPGKPEEALDREIWQAYEKIASLVDVNDAFFRRNENGEINPRSLLI